MPPDDDELAEAMLHAAQALVGLAARAAAELEDVSLAQLRVLVVLKTRGPQTLGALAEVLGINPSGSTRLADRLVAKGFVTRQPSPLDRRVTELHLTDGGTGVVDEYVVRRRASLSPLVAAIPENERADAIEILHLLGDLAGEPPPGADPWPRSDAPPAGAPR
jgi:DNA-binding MarR family transcriptional regulator